MNLSNLRGGKHDPPQIRERACCSQQQCDLYRTFGVPISEVLLLRGNDPLLVYLKFGLSEVSLFLRFLNDLTSSCINQLRCFIQQ